MLMVVVSSPGGAYSNWWCSLFNADLALSITATTCSTVLSVGLLPLKCALVLTIPDVRRAGRWRRRPAALATNIGASVAWLALLSFAMISCCERLGDLLRCRVGGCSRAERHVALRERAAPGAAAGQQLLAAVERHGLCDDSGAACAQERDECDGSHQHEESGERGDRLQSISLCDHLGDLARSRAAKNARRADARGQGRRAGTRRVDVPYSQGPFPRRT